MNIERLETLLKKVESAAGIINQLKDNETTYKQKIEQLITKLEISSRENADLKDQNKFLKEQLNNNELIHNNIEQKIINILEKLPDFEITENNSKSNDYDNNISDNELIENEIIKSHYQEENINNNLPESNEINESNESFFESHENKNQDYDNNNETSLPPKNTQSIFDLSNDNNEDLTNTNQSLPHFEENNDNEEVFSNMFAFDDIIDSNNETENTYQVDRDLPKGVI